MTLFETNSNNILNDNKDIQFKLQNFQFIYTQLLNVHIYISSKKFTGR